MLTYRIVGVTRAAIGRSIGRVAQVIGYVMRLIDKIARH